MTAARHDSTRRLPHIPIAAFLAAVALLCFGAGPAGAAPSEPPETVLSENDIGRAEDMTTPGRWGKPETQDKRTFRTYPGRQSLSYVGINPWWKGGDASPDDVVISVTFKDTTSGPVSVQTWNGTGMTYGYNALGFIGGANDGAWKDVLMICPKGLLKIRRGAEPEGLCWMLFHGGGNIAVDRIRVLKSHDLLLLRAVGLARVARVVSIAALKKTFQHVPWKETTPLGEVGEEFKRLGFIPYVRSYMREVRPGSIPKPEERGNRPLRAYATPGEFEPLQVAAYALKDITLTASISDLKGPGLIKADRDIKIHWVESVPMRVGSSWGKRYQVMPAWMRPGEPRVVPAKASQAWYVTVHVPPGTKPGLYKGRFTLTARSGPAVRFPVEFRVLPFVLDKVDHIARGPYVATIIGDEFIRDLREHGMNSTSIFSRTGFAPKLIDGKCTASISAEMNRYLRKLKQAGFVRAVHFGGGDPQYQNPANVPGATGSKVGTPEFEAHYGQFWQDIRRLEKANGWPEIICCPFDEPVKSAAKTRNYEICYEIVKKATPQTKVFCVFMNRRGAAAQLGRKADIWSCNGAFEVNQAEKTRLAAQGIHKLFYTYTGAMGCTRPGAARYNAGVLPWHHDADGTYFWAYLWSGGDPFNDLDAGHRDWSPVARDVDGKVYGTIGWEGYREGVDDLRYIHTCMRMAAEKGRKDVLEEIARLKQGVKKGRESAESQRTRGLDDFFFKLDDADVLDIYRARVVSMILDMLGKKP